MSNNIYTFLGLAVKAGKLVSGGEMCERMVRSGKACLVIVAEDASDNTRKMFEDSCNNRNIEMRIFGEKELLGKYIGKPLRSVVAVLDSNFAGKLIKMIDERKKENGGAQIVKSKNI